MATDKWLRQEKVIKYLTIDCISSSFVCLGDYLNHQCGQSQQVMKLPRDKRQAPITNVDGKCLGALRVPKSKITPVIIVTV